MRASPKDGSDLESVTPGAFRSHVLPHPAFLTPRGEEVDSVPHSWVAMQGILYCPWALRAWAHGEGWGVSTHTSVMTPGAGIEGTRTMGFCSHLRDWKRLSDRCLCSGPREVSASAVHIPCTAQHPGCLGRDCSQPGLLSVLCFP